MKPAGDDWLATFMPAISGHPFCNTSYDQHFESKLMQEIPHRKRADSRANRCLDFRETRECKSKQSGI